MPGLHDDFGTSVSDLSGSGPQGLLFGGQADTGSKRGVLPSLFRFSDACMTTLIRTRRQQAYEKRQWTKSREVGRLRCGGHASQREESSYPPYNIEKCGEDQYRIVMALAGFTKDDIEIVSEQNRLYVRGKMKGQNGGTFLHRGIAARSFERQRSPATSPSMSSGADAF